MENEGLKELHKTGFVLIAGGLGERLGYSGIKIDSSTVSVTQTAYIGDSKPGAKDASESSPPTHFRLGTLPIRSV